MPLCTVSGALCVFGALAHVPQLQLHSTFQYYLLTLFLPYSHASEECLASLLVPGLPDALNFVAYHRRYHIEPSRNFGLVVPTDLLWDKVV